MKRVSNQKGYAKSQRYNLKQLCFGNAESAQNHLTTSLLLKAMIFLASTDSIFLNPLLFPLRNITPKYLSIPDAITITVDAGPIASQCKTGKSGGATAWQQGRWKPVQCRMSGCFLWFALVAFGEWRYWKDGETWLNRKLCWFENRYCR